MKSRHSTFSLSSSIHIGLLLLLFLLVIPLVSCAGPLTGGGNWQLSTLDHQQIRVLAVDPNNFQDIYAGDTQGNIFFSADSAQHWTLRSAELRSAGTPFALSFDAKGKALYAATPKGLFVSRDAGKDWNALSSSAKPLPLDAYTALAFDFITPGTIYVSTTHHGIFVSKDNGATWAAISHDLPQGVQVHNLTYDSDQHQLWAATSTGIYRFDERANLWLPRNTGLPASLNVYTVQLASVSAGPKGLLYAGTSHGFFLSQDGGTHWTVGQVPLAHISIYAVLIDFRAPGGKTVYIGTNIGALMSLDGGQTWQAVGPGLPSGLSIYALAIGGTDNSQLLAAAPTNIYVFPGTTGGFTVWKLLPLLLMVAVVFFVYRFFQRSRKRMELSRSPQEAVDTEEAPEASSQQPEK